MRFVNYVNGKSQRKAIMLHVQHQSSGTARLILQEIRLRMPVYDVMEIGLGVVVRVYDQANTEYPLVGRAPIYPRLDCMPVELASRLRQEGYLEVDSGLLSGDFFILPRQIADVTEKGVFLLLHRDELIQL